MMEDQGAPEGKEEPTAAVGVKERSVAEDPQVCGTSGVKTKGEQMKEPGGAERPRVTGGAKKWEKPRQC